MWNRVMIRPNCHGYDTIGPAFRKEPVPLAKKGVVARFTLGSLKGECHGENLTAFLGNNRHFRSQHKRVCNAIEDLKSPRHFVQRVF
jgi:hypothetical protein